MSIFDKIKNIFFIPGTPECDQRQEFERVINMSTDYFASEEPHFWTAKINELPLYKDQIIHWQDKKKIDFIDYCVRAIHSFTNGKKTWHSRDTEQQRNTVRTHFIKHLLKSSLQLEEADIKRLIDLFLQFRQSDWSLIYNWPVAPLLNQVEKQYRAQNISASLSSVLESLKNDINKIEGSYYEKEKIKILEKIDSFLFSSQNESGKIKPAKFLGEDDFAAHANKAIEKLPDGEKVFWYQLITLAQKASGSKPSNKFLDASKTIFKELGTDKFKKTVNDWLVFLINLKEKSQAHAHTYDDGRIYNYTSIEYISAINVEAIKGFVWMCSHFHDNATLNNIANLAERSYKKIPGKGPAAASLGNACIYVLYKSKGLDGIGHLSRLKLRIKQSNVQSAIEKYLDETAKEQGVSINEIEDMAVDDFGLTEGSKEFEFDEHRAVLSISGIGKSEIKWFRPDGTGQKSIPAFIKDKYATRLKKLKDLSNQIDKTTSAQRDRIDQMFRSGRKWSMEELRSSYLEHGLMSIVTKNIIWKFSHNDKIHSAILINNKWINNVNEIVEPAPGTEISLWHPAIESIEEIKNWREFLVFHKQSQPLKQAFREVYLLTDAELNTKTYSNRMAGHILKQHQFNSLAKTRGWKYSLLGAYDGGRFNQAAEVKLPDFNLKVAYWVNEVNADNAFNDTGIWNYISTDQIRFTEMDSSKVLDLVDIPAIPFSEVLRDIDLFVGVASVGNDPTWRDSGGVPAYRDYWTAYSFGDLSEIAKSRKEILIGLVPRLKISKVAEIKDKFLVVKGKFRTYKIHIGSTNILMEPNDQYLCIVPDRSQKTFTENIFLPFEGDTGLSIILSKAFLLADDEHITDSTITSQIHRK